MKRARPIANISSHVTSAQVKHVLCAAWVEKFRFGHAKSHPVRPTRPQVQSAPSDVHTPHAAATFDMLVASDVGGKGYSYVD